MGDVHPSLLKGPRLRNDLYCVEWDVKLYYTIPLTVLCGLQHNRAVQYTLKMKKRLRQMQTLRASWL